MKRFFFLFFFFLFIMSFLINAPKISSDELDDLNKQINDLTSALNMSKAATAPLESQLTSMKAQIADIKAGVVAIEQDVLEKEKHIAKGYQDLSDKQGVLNLAISNYYIKSYYNTPLLALLSVSSASEITQVLAYQKATTDRDKAIITNLALSIEDLETKKQNLESEKTRLTQVKASLDEKSKDLDKIVSGARAYQSVLSNKIIQLSARQQEILGQRLAGLNIPRSAGTAAPACVDDRDKDPGFSPRLAFFTYGVPNRTGLNQYGARGRAASQGHEDILRAYYNDISFETRPNINIKVQGYGEMPLETYLLGIYEMPEDWPMETLKAQVIAARSYALAYTNNGAGEICTTQSCQVYKQPHKSGQWVAAVSETFGKVMVQGGQVIKAWYSSTHGGYILRTDEIGWSGTSWTKHAVDTPSGSVGSFGELTSNAYDKDSPWFYCDWGSRSGYNKTAWLKSEEVADIVNTLLLVQADGSSAEHLYQTDKSNPAGTDNYDEGRVKDELRKKGITPYNSVSDISVGADFGAGTTSSINVTGDGGSKSFSGSDFKNRFNLRAPANIQIVGPLYNIEKR